MKKVLLKIGLLSFLAAILFSCSQEEKTLDQKETQGEVSFQFNISDLAEPSAKSTNDAVFFDSCLEFSRIIALVKADSLVANITIGTDPNNINTGRIDMVVPLIYITGDKIQTTVYPIPLGTYYVHSAIITKVDDGTPLFAGIKAGGLFDKYVPDGEHMGEKTFTFDENEKYKKNLINLWVLCATNATPEDFGFVKWHLNYVRAHCFGFLVDICDEKTGDMPARGVLKIDYIVNKDTTTLHNMIFNSAESMANFCFKDDYSINNNVEKYHISMSIGSVTYDTIITLTNLLKYDLPSNPAWDAEKKFMHIDFCSCNTWIFDCDENEDHNPPTPESECVERLRFVEGGSPTGGSDNYLEFWLYKKDSNGNFVGDGDNIKNEPLEDYEYWGVGNLANFEIDNIQGVFRLQKGLGCRSVNSVPYGDGRKIMKIELDIKATSPLDPNTVHNLCDILIFKADGTYIGRFPYQGKVGTPQANNITFQFDQIKNLINSWYGQHVENDPTPEACYRVGVWTFIDAQWEIDIKNFYVQTQGE